jgi:hypothetical protein
MPLNEKIIYSKEEFIMLTELIIFAVVLVTLNVVAGILMTFLAFKIVFSDKFMDWYMGKILGVSASVQNILKDDDDL